MHHIKRARMLLSIGDHTNTPQVSTSGHHAHVAYLHTEKRKNYGQPKYQIPKQKDKDLKLNIVCSPTCFKLDEICNFACVQVNTDGVVNLDKRIRVTDGAGIMGHQMWDSLCANEDFPHLAQFVLQQDNSISSKDLQSQKNK